MSRIRNFAIGLLLSISVLLIGSAAFAQTGVVDVDICWIKETGVGPLIDIPTVPAPCPNLQDGLARSSCHYYYTTNGGGAQEYIYKIDFLGALAGIGWYAGANFQALAYVTNAYHGSDMLYGLDEIGNQLIEFDPVTMTPTGILIPIAPGIGRRAIAGGYQHVTVQIDNGGVYSLWKYNTFTGAWGPSILTPMGGVVLFDGLSLRGGVHLGTEVVAGGSDLWRRPMGGAWVHLGAGFPSRTHQLSALGAF